jgi:hypothetical protein
MCGDMVLCATCGNNCCNAGYGDVNGEKCADCPEAYEHQSAFWKDQNSVKFAKDDRKEPGRPPPTPEEAQAVVAKWFESLGVKPSE